MKALRLSLLLSVLGCLTAVAAVPPVLPAPLVGGYQALLYTGADNTGVPSGLVTITTTANGKATGKLTTDENKTYLFSATFNYIPDQIQGDELEGISNSNVISIPRTKLTPLSLVLNIVHNKVDVVHTPVFKAVLSGTGVDMNIPKRTSNSGFKNITFAPKTTANWAGKYTLAFEGADAAGAGVPQGSGYATGVVSTAGVLALAGKTADGVAFTASLSSGPDRNYVAYLNPHKTVNSFLGGKINLVSRTPAAGFHAVAAVSPLVDFQWKKAPKALDKSYPSGFGPIGILVTMEPWVALLPKQTLAQAYGMTDKQMFDIAFSSHFNTTTYAARTPTALGLDAKNAFYVATGATGSPSPLIPANWTKFFTIKVAPTTGVVTGSLTITDSVPTLPPALPGKPPKAPTTVTRKLVIEGVMLRLPTIGAEAFASGFMTVPPINPKTATTLSAAFAFNGPFKADPLAQGMAQIAGKYQAIFDLVTGAPAKPNSIPANNTTVNFTVAADLKSITFNGRKVDLLTDARPLNLVYFSQTNPIITVTLTMSLVTGDIQKCDANYFNRVGYTMHQYAVLSRNNPVQTIVKLP